MLGQTLGWWIIVELLSLVTLPIALTVFERLPGRGYAFAKPFSLLLGGYLYWLVLTMHLLSNRPGSIAWVFIFLAAISLVIVSRRKEALLEQLRDNAGFIVAAEVVFFLTFFTAAHLKSYLPEIAGTEKPMDFMFLNSASRSHYFPPSDPWLSGFSISYYYFGYVINAMVGKLIYMPTAVTFNLALASTAALAGTAAFGLGYELANLARRISFKVALAVGVAALVFITLLGNLEGALEFGMANDSSVGHSLAQRADIANLNKAAASSSCVIDVVKCVAYPTEQSSFWWWWRATRISPDANSITEFPFFSFLLGDLHPHVMAIPYVLTVIALGLALFRDAERLTYELWRRRPFFLLVSSLLLGGLGFLNTWDLPTFGFLVALLVVARSLIDTKDPAQALKDAGGFLLPLFVLAAILYLPFYVSFGSQASGFESVRSGATRPIHSFLFWAPLFSVSLPLPLVLLGQDRRARSMSRIVRVALLPVGLLVLWLAVVAFGGYSVSDAVSARGWNWLTTLFLASGLTATVLALFSAIEKAAPDPDADLTYGPAPAVLERRRRAHEAATDEPSQLTDRVLVPILALMSTALLLILGGELFYVKDVFSSRLNTVFKLSYQAWLLLGVSGAFSLYWLVERWQPAPAAKSRVFRGAWAMAASLAVAGAMLYPLGATLSRTEGLAKPNRTLNGLADAHRNDPEDAAALDWLKSHVDRGERLVEGTGGQYSPSGRIASWSGVPTVIGWVGHEVQWGRSNNDIGTRQDDVDRIYMSSSLGEALSILQKYDVTYVMVGSVENAKYPPEGLKKFDDLTPAFRLGNTSIYRVPIQGEDSAARAQ